MPDSGAKQNFVERGDSGFQKEKDFALLRNTSHHSLRALSQIKINRESKTLLYVSLMGRIPFLRLSNNFVLSFLQNSPLIHPGGRTKIPIPEHHFTKSPVPNRQNQLIFVSPIFKSLGKF